MVVPTLKAYDYTMTCHRKALWGMFGCAKTRSKRTKRKLDFSPTKRRQTPTTSPIKKKSKKGGGPSRADLALEKKNARAEKLEQQERVIELLLLDKVEKGHADYISFSKRVIEAAARSEITYEQGHPLMGISRQAFGRHAKNAKHNWGESTYQGPEAGQDGAPVKACDKAKAQILDDIVNTRLTRQGKGKKGLAKVVRKHIQTSQAQRGVKVVPDDWVPSDKYVKDLTEQLGIAKRASGRDNGARTSAYKAGRNLLSNFACLAALCLSFFTFDFKTVHPRNRGNFDVVTLYTRHDDGKVYTVVKKTALMEADPLLTQNYDDAFDQPITRQSDEGLCQVKIALLMSHKYYAIFVAQHL